MIFVCFDRANKRNNNNKKMNEVICHKLVLTEKCDFRPIPQNREKYINFDTEHSLCSVHVAGHVDTQQIIYHWKAYILL